MDVSIIIVNYNTCSLTRNCLKSVFEQTKEIDFEVIVSDNGSKDGSVEMIKTEFPQVILIENNANLGFGKANNVGYKYSKGKYIFLLNSDTILLNNAVKYFADEMQSLNENIACMGCKLTGSNGKYIHSYGNFPTFWNEMRRRPFSFLDLLGIGGDGFDSKPYVHIENNCFIVEYITGADLFIRRDVIEKYGLFDEDFFMYYEDPEMQYRYKKNGFYSCLTTKPKIRHLEGGSNTGKKRLDFGLNGLMLCYEKMYGKRRKIFFKIMLFLLSLPTVTLYLSFSIKEKLEYFKGILSN